MPINPIDLLRAAGVNPEQHPPDERRCRQLQEIIAQIQKEPLRVAAQLAGTQHQLALAQRNCEKASEAATKLQSMLNELLDGNKLMCRLETIRDTTAGPRAICRSGGHLRELPVHPDVDVDQLRQLNSWDYVSVHEQIVVGTWSDPLLFANAHGEVVQLKGYQDRAANLVRVAHGPEERVVQLCPALAEQEVAPGTQLVLQRDDPHRAISMVEAAVTHSRFEIAAEQLQTRLEDLAGVDELARQVLEDVLLRIVHGNIRDQFGLDPLKGLLLHSRPGMGKTALIRALSRWLFDHRDLLDIDVVVYFIPPNATKNMYHGEDARIVREEVWGPIRARQAMPRSRALVQILILDEVDALGKRPGAADRVTSAAQSDSLQAMLSEWDGVIQEQPSDGPPAYTLVVGLTNRPESVDEAAKRPGRFDLVLSMPAIDRGSAEDVMAVYARGDDLPWYSQDAVRTGLDESEIRAQFLRPALAHVFDLVILRYQTDAQRSIDVTAGQVLANVHYKEAVNRAKKRGALRQLREHGIPAVTCDDVVDCLLEVAVEFAQQVEVDPAMLIRQLNVKVLVTRVEAVPDEQLQQHRYLRVHSA